MAYFGIGTQVGSPYLKNNLLVGDASFQCTSDGYNQASSLDWAQLSSPSDPNAAVFTYFWERPSELNLGTCIALLDAGEIAKFDDYRQLYPTCDSVTSRPSYQSAIQVTGTPLKIAYALYPAGQQIIASTKGAYPTLQVDIFEDTDPLTGTVPNPAVPATVIDCSLPFAKAGECLETLAEWAQTQLSTVYGTTQTEALRASAALRTQIQQKLGPVPPPAASGGTPAPGCTAPLNEGVEAKLAELQPVPLKAAPRKGESGPITKVSIAVSFSPLGFHLCEEGLLGGSIDPGAFEIGVAPALTVRDQDPAHHALGPFVYDAESHGWESSAQIPPGQDLDTHYNGSLRVELGPQVSATLDPAKVASGGAPDVSLDLLSVVVQARQQKVTLVRNANGQELLQAVDSPQLVFSLGISPKDVEDEVADDEAAGEQSAGQLISDAAQDISSTDAVAMADEIEATAGVSADYADSAIPTVEGVISDVVENTFVDDPVLVSIAAEAAAEGDEVAAEGLGGEITQNLKDLLDQSPEEDVQSVEGLVPEL